MTHEAFVALMEDRITKVRAVLAAKAKEYATQDRLHNFKQAGAFLRCSPEAALMGMLTKHLVCIADMVQAVNGGATFPLAVWEEKLGDAVNYLILLEALVKSKKEAG